MIRWRKAIRMGLWPALLPVAVSVGGCSGAADPMGERKPFIAQRAFPGVSWLGTWHGTAEGTRAGTVFRDDGMVLHIFRDGRPACAAGFAVRIGILFDRCGLVPGSEVSANFEYETDSTRHLLIMDRYSGDGQTANVILGRVRVERRPGGSALPLVEAVFTVVRR